MKRYTFEEKERAMQSMSDIGVEKTAETLGISTATLYGWKRAAGVAKPARTKRATTVPKTTKAAKKECADAQESVAEARKLLLEDNDAAETISRLALDNAALREQNQKLRKALAALID